MPDFLDGGEGVGSGRDNCGSLRPSPKVKPAKSQQTTIPIEKKEKLVTPIRQGMNANQQRQTSSGAKPLSPTRLETVTSIPTHVSAGRREPRTVASKDLKEVVRLLCASKRNLP